jgi:hypothetical protein
LQAATRCQFRGDAVETRIGAQCRFYACMATATLGADLIDDCEETWIYRRDLRSNDRDEQEQDSGRNFHDVFFG